MISPDQDRRLIFVRARDSGGNWGPVRAVFAPATGGHQTLLPLVAQ